MIERHFEVQEFLRYRRWSRVAVPPLEHFRKVVLVGVYVWPNQVIKILERPESNLADPRLSKRPSVKRRKRKK